MADKDHGHAPAGMSWAGKAMTGALAFVLFVIGINALGNAIERKPLFANVSAGSSVNGNTFGGLVNTGPAQNSKPLKIHPPKTAPRYAHACTQMVNGRLVTGKCW